MAFAYRMTWGKQGTSEVRITVDCGLNRQHAEWGSRKLLPGFQLLESQYLGEVSGPDELRARWGTANASKLS